MLRSDDGIAMITVIGVISVVTVIAIGAFAMSRQSLHESVLVRSESQAFHLASAGIEVVLETIQRGGFDESLYPMGGTLAAGTWQTTVSKLTDAEYLATSTGTTSEGVSETVEVKFFYLNIWEMNLAAGSKQSITAGGGGLNGTANIVGPFYAVGTIEMGGGARVLSGPLFIKGGDIIVTGASTVGAPLVEGQPYSGPINVYCDGALIGRQDRYFISYRSQGVPTIELPTVDDDYTTEQWSKARAESVDNLIGYPPQGEDAGTPNLESVGGDPTTYRTMQPPNTATFSRAKAPGASAQYKYIGPSSGPSAMGEGTTHLVIGGTGSWGTGSDDPRAEGYPAGSHDDFYFDDTTNMLYVQGTVFVDGPVTFAEDITYRGNGAIIANGDIYIHGKLAPATVGGELDASAAMGLVTPKNILCETPSSNKDFGDVPDLSGAFFARGNVRFKHNILCVGAVVAGGITFDHPNTKLVTNPNLPSFLPESMPGRGLSILSQGAWARR
ncbi:MAG: hypothetical protein IBX62_02835 [Coriobacteriia bacterium]|nr:hypothetical protein [Coriobacteriia bacterium]